MRATTMDHPENEIYIEPIISYPRQAEPGKTYLMTVDLKPVQQGGVWPYSEEEYVVHCHVNAGSLFEVQQQGETDIVVHRFGGTYGPATFLLTAASEEQRGHIEITLVNGWGVPIDMIELLGIQVAAREEGFVSGRSVSTQRGAIRIDGFSATASQDSIVVNRVDQDTMSRRDVYHTAVSKAADGSAVSTGGRAIVSHIVNIYRGHGKWSEEDYRAALDRYLQWVCVTTGQVVLRGTKRGGQQAVELPLDEVYVPLAAETLPEARAELDRDLRRASVPPEMGASRQIIMRDLLSQGNRLTVIGAPGCGKTTVLQHIAWTLGEALRTGQFELAAERLDLSGELPLPIYVPLSLYADHRRRFADHTDPRQHQLTTFISQHLLERQAGLNLPDDFFAPLLDQGRHVILLLDGLDEVPNEDERALVSQAVRDVISGRPNVRAVVTSRTSAYRGRAVLGADFRVVRVLPLNPEEVADLIWRVYRAIYPQNVEAVTRERQARELAQAVEKLEAERLTRLGKDSESRLVTTPLMVRMLLIVHFNLRRLPDQRAELYMEVVNALLTSWHDLDEAVARQLAQLGGDWRERRDMCQYVAFQMHNRGQEAGRELGERELGDLLRDYLIARQHRTVEVAAELVDDFIAASRQRGGLMEEVGGRYRFTHLSFQEFLAARYLAEVERDVERIARFIEDQGRATDPWWREPVLLTLGYLNLTAPESATELIKRLAGGDDRAEPTSSALLGAAELAATAFLEWGGTDPLRAALARRLASLLENPHLLGLPGAVRGWAGLALARLGDPRTGVGLDAHGLPDIAWCEIPSGEFVMGSTKQADPIARGDEQPQHRVILDTYRISRYPITNTQYQAFVRDGGYTESWRRCWTKVGWDWKGDRAGPDKYGGTFDLPNHPVVGVSWHEAVAFCSWLGERLGTMVTLPTEPQWEKAARGADGRSFPWGTLITPDHANYSATGIESTSAVGVFPSGASPYGVLDMGGNTWEWTRSLWGDDILRPGYAYPYHPADGRENLDAVSTVLRVVRGGAYKFDEQALRCAYRGRNYPGGRWEDYGFRVVALPRETDYLIEHIEQTDGASPVDKHETMQELVRSDPELARRKLAEWVVEPIAYEEWESAVHILTELDMELARETLMLALSSPEEGLRSHAATRLAGIANEKSWRALQQALVNDPMPELRSQLYEDLAHNPFNRTFLLQQHAWSMVRSIDLTQQERDSAKHAVDDLHHRLSEMKALKEAYIETTLFGSQPRDTAIRPLSDVDILVLFRINPDRENPQAAHRILEIALDRIYGNQVVKPQDASRGGQRSRRRSSFGASVLVHLPEHWLEILPAVYSRKKPSQVLVPRRSLADWVPTNHEIHAAFSQEQNTRTNGAYSAMVKMVKWWQYFHSPWRRYLTGFILECLVAAHAKFGDRSLLMSFSDFMMTLKNLYKTEVSLKRVPEPGVPSGFKITNLDPNEFGAFMNLIDKTIDLSQKALRASTLNEAVLHWRMVFGPEFPDTLSKRRTPGS